MTENNDKTVYILDSYGLIYRCYFAFINRPLTNASGQNVSALFGFFRNLHSVLKHYKPAYIAAAFDSLTPTFRHEMYSEYKATRQKTPDDLIAQIPLIENVLKALNIPVLRCNGFEADDVIATVAEKCRQAGRECRILSGDKDLMQLVNGTTKILKPDHADVWKIVGSDGVKAEWGVEPEKLLDLLSLYGDTADNVPGVKGVGVKTAVKFLDLYGSLEGIYEHADEIKGAIGEKIREGKENAFFSKKLIKLCCEVPLTEKDSIKPANLNYQAAAKLLNEYGVPAVAKQYGQDGVENDFALKGASGNVAGGSAADESAAGEHFSGGSSAEAGEAESLPQIVENKGNYRAVTDIAALEEFTGKVLAMENPVVAFDCETDSLQTYCANMLGFSLCMQKGEAIYVPVSGEQQLFAESEISRTDAVKILERLFGCDRVTVVMHNGKFDWQVLRTNGLKTGEKSGKKGGCCKPECRIADTMVAAWLLEPDRNGRNAYSLENLAETKLGLKGIEFDEIVKKGQTFADVPLDKAVPYAAEDADFTLQLWQFFEPLLEKNGFTELFWQTEMKVLPVLAEMELYGIHLDKNALDSYSVELEQEITLAEKDIYKTVGHEFNIASTKQLQEVLFTELGLKPGKKTKTGYSTDTAVLEELASENPVPKKILEYRSLTKLQSTYVEALPKLADSNSRIHTSFMQTGTATGRLSSRDPNLQNIPVREEAGRRIRSAFTAVPGTVLISADYAQIELVVLSHLSGDENMCRAFNEGTDVHRFTASLIFGVAPENVTPQQRRLAKTINFGVIYGMSAFRLANELDISRTQAQQFINDYFATFSAIQNYKSNLIAEAEKKGYVETLFGHRRPIPSINSRNKMEKSAAERMAVNTPVQGSAADIVKKAMIDVDEALSKTECGAKLLLQVHDELIFECPDSPDLIEETIALIKDKMENAVKLSVPLKVSVEYGKNWGEFH